MLIRSLQIHKNITNGITVFMSTRSTAIVDTACKPKFIPFQQVLADRRTQALHSLIVQVQSAQSYHDLYRYCSSIAPVQQMFYYSAGIEPLHFVLVEFKDDSAVQSLLRDAYGHRSSDIACVPVHSQFMWFKAESSHPKKIPPCPITLQMEQNPSADEIKVQMTACNSITEQMVLLYHCQRLTELGCRLRFMAARQLELALSGMFPNGRALPFGSSVNSFGRRGCDLDLVYRFAPYMTNTEKRLMFQVKSLERWGPQKNLEVLAEVLQSFLPGCSNVRKILQARVPIIKFYQHILHIECDLSTGSNISGVYMSDFLYMMSSIDERVAPLVFTIRQWAKEVGLTNASPGRWITNFSLTLMVLAFLQHNGPILPQFDTLVKMAGPDDKFVTDDGTNYSFLRNINKLKLENFGCTDTLEELLFKFFVHYSQFDFQQHAICLNTYKPNHNYPKPDFSPLYIVNPLERGLNVSRNVGNQELYRFQMELKSAAWEMESFLQSDKGRKVNWGLLSLFKSGLMKDKVEFQKDILMKSRLMSVKSLFNEENSVESTQ